MRAGECLIPPQSNAARRYPFCQLTLKCFKVIILRSKMKNVAVRTTEELSGGPGSPAPLK